MKIKSLEVEKYTALRDKTLSEIKRGYKIQTATMIILAILTLIVCFGNMKQAIDYEALNREKKALEEYIETQSSMISDLEENCRELYIEIENMKFGGNVN